jgi:type I restriction enzyme M protein
LPTPEHSGAPPLFSVGSTLPLTREDTSGSFVIRKFLIRHFLSAPLKRRRSMLDTETKRRIDTARDILVGKVPDPKSQVEQITIALIYKFMDDMDAESEELGGTRSFFAGAYERFGWAKLMRSGLGGHETLSLYSEAISKMPENPGMPPLFREIFKNAYLPYRDPETLRAFLKIIDGFTYDHSERLGDAFEYLLSVLGSQGDAGQFRTPRHIIDFMVAVVDPKKNEKVLDPACGTAGFLISSYKHILRQNTNAKGHSTLTPDDKAAIARNFKGYDISPDMVRLSLVNLYLHGFSDPHIYEYDTLTSEEHWNKSADVILANPPFMSPKGGIKPHKRFSIPAKRSEVLFVDYMAEHLTPTGRAAIIVPEGIIFQSQGAYKELRKMLVENSLVAVVSLPAGCFNPYSGVKTSILIIDRSIAPQSDTIAFFKVENDGFGLGAQRRAIGKNDLPQVQAELAAYLHALRTGASTERLFDLTSTAQVVPKAKLAANGDYNLSGERYREESSALMTFPRVRLAEVCEAILTGPFGSSLHESDYVANGIPVINPKNIVDGVVVRNGAKMVSAATKDRLKEFTLRENDIVIARRGEMGRCTVVTADMDGWLCGTGCFVIRLKPTCELGFAYLQLSSPKVKARLKEQAVGVTLLNLNQGILADLEIPLPPLELQREIVAEIEGYQKVINGARAVLDHYRPHIPIHPDWPTILLGEICSFKNGLNFDKSSSGYTTKIIGVSDFKANLYAPLEDLNEVHLAAPLSSDYLVQAGDILFVRSNGNPDLVGRSMLVPPPLEPTTFSGFTIRGRIHDKRAMPVFFGHFFKSRDFAEMIKTVGQGANIRNLSQGILNGLEIPLPPLATQQAIVAEIEAEQALVAANRELIARFEKKIQATLARVWGEKAEMESEQTVPA